MLNDETVVAKVAKCAVAIGFPRHGDMVAFLQVVRLDMLLGDAVRAVALADMFQETVPRFSELILMASFESSLKLNQEKKRHSKYQCAFMTRTISLIQTKITKDTDRFITMPLLE